MSFNSINCNLLDCVRPITWKNPNYSRKYDLVVIGGGIGGITTAKKTAKLGAKVALIENFILGGETLYTGSIPSKAFLKCANIAHAAKTAS